MSEAPVPNARAMNTSRERPAWSTSGYLMLVLFLALLGLFLWRLTSLAGGEPTDAEVLGFIGSIFLLPVALVVIAKGFYPTFPK